MPEIQIPTYCAYGWLILFLLFEISLMITGIVLTPNGKECIGGAGSVTLPFWLFVNGIVGSILSIIIIAYYATRICHCYTEESRSICGAIPREFKSACFWISNLIPLLFRLSWLIVAIVLLSGTSTECSIRSSMTGLIVLHMFITVFSTLTMIKLAFSSALNSD